MSVRNTLQYFYDGSALRTIFGRKMILMLALAQLGTPYTRAGADPEGGFDCSGLVYYLYTNVYGKNIFGPHRLWTVSAQYDYLKSKKMTHPYDDKLDGDILWSDGYGHTGIYYGIPMLIQGEVLVTDSVIHANRGRWFSAVVITSTNNAAFAGSGIMDDIGRPVP
jgi:cell wall-associated NlpC family hydrolase